MQQQRIARPPAPHQQGEQPEHHGVAEGIGIGEVKAETPRETIDQLLADHGRHEHADSKRGDGGKQPATQRGRADPMVDADDRPKAEQAPATHQKRRRGAKTDPLVDNLDVEVGDLHSPSRVGQLDAEHDLADRGRDLEHGREVLARGAADQAGEQVGLVPELGAIPGLLHQVDPRSLPGLLASLHPVGGEIGTETEARPPRRQADRAPQVDRPLGVPVLERREAELDLVEGDQALDLPAGEAVAKVCVVEDRTADILVARQVGEGQDGQQGQQRGQSDGQGDRAQRAPAQGPPPTARPGAGL